MMNKVVDFLQANPVQYLGTIGRDGKAKCHQAGPLRRTPHPVQADGYARLPPLLRGAEKGRLNVQPPFFQALFKAFRRQLRHQDATAGRL